METLPLPARRHRPPTYVQFIASIELVISSIPHYAFPGPRRFRVSSLFLRYYYYYYYFAREYRQDIA